MGIIFRSRSVHRADALELTLEAFTPVELLQSQVVNWSCGTNGKIDDSPRVLMHLPAYFINHLTYCINTVNGQNDSLLLNPSNERPWSEWERKGRKFHLLMRHESFTFTLFYYTTQTLSGKCENFSATNNNKTNESRPLRKLKLEKRSGDDVDFLISHLNCNINKCHNTLDQNDNSSIRHVTCRIFAYQIVTHN